MSGKVTVAVRARPMNAREERTVQAMLANSKLAKVPRGFKGHIVRMKDDITSVLATMLGKDEDRHFTYDHSFWSAEPGSAAHVSQSQVYETLGKELLDNAFLGYNACIFAYGQTGSGKTYTMTGEEGDEGLIPRICNEMFTRAAEATTDTLKFKIECSYMEIYNERVRDLLAMNGKKVNLRVREHKILGPYVEDLKTFAVEDYEAIEVLMGIGKKARVTASTQMNDSSSRSHAVFTINITQSQYDEVTGNTGEKTSRVSLVDLAGSERVGRSGAEGERLKEGGNINKSLSTLGLVISTLADKASGKKAKDAFVPYRDSILTWLLKENLGGNSKTVMIATVSPSVDNFEETISTLRYADYAKRIETHAVVNEDENAKLIRELKDEVGRLRSMLQGAGAGGVQVVSDTEMKALQERLAESERLMRTMSMSWEEKLKMAHAALEERAKMLKEMGISVKGDGIAVNSTKIYLLNMNSEREEDELLMYYLKGVSRLGSSRGQDITVKGDGIKPEHCIFTVEAGQLQVMPLKNAAVAIDDQVVTKKTPVQHGAQIKIGTNHMFRANCPSGLQREKTMDLEGAFAELEDVLPSTGSSWPGSKLHRACELGDLALVQYLVEHGQPANSDDARWHRCPLMLAADNGHIDVCKFLIEQGADAGKADDRGFTPLHASADSGHLEVVQLLIAHGANPDPHADIGCTPLHRAAHMGHLEVCKVLRQQGANVNAQDSGKGWVPIHLASLGGHHKVVSYLVQEGAHVNVQNRFGETALHLSADPGHVEIIKTLISVGADASIEQAHGRLAYDYASETTTFLLLHSPPVRVTNRAEVCRLLHPLMLPEQRRVRKLGEQKSVLIGPDWAKVAMSRAFVPNGQPPPARARAGSKKGPGGARGARGSPRGQPSPQRSSSMSRSRTMVQSRTPTQPSSMRRSTTSMGSTSKPTRARQLASTGRSSPHSPSRSNTSSPSRSSSMKSRTGGYAAKATTRRAVRG